MKKMIDIRLLSTCIIAGVPRSPVEGLQTVPEDEGKRLIDLGMAVDAGDDVEREDDPGDGLEARAMTDKKLRALAEKEGVVVKGDADRPTIVAAIRARRALFDGTGIDPMDDAGLWKIVEDEKIDATNAGDTASLILAITSGRAPAA